MVPLAILHAVASATISTSSPDKLPLIHRERTVNSKKLRDKKRRRAAKLSTQAWEAAEEGDLLFARKLMQRAIGLCPANPRLRCDDGMLALMDDDRDQAAKSFQDAISLAPDFAEPYAHLADLRLRQGMVFDALRLIDSAVELDPTSSTYAKRQSTYRQLAGVPLEGESSSHRAPIEHSDCPIAATLREQFPKLAESIEQQDWSAITDKLTRKGIVHLSNFAPKAWCDACLALEYDETRFAQTVHMDKPRFGRGVYRYFANPLPPEIDAMRRLLYPPLAAIANQWQQTLCCQVNQEATSSYPPHWEGFRIRCAHAGQTSPTPLFLTYPEGGFNAFHRDLRGHVVFPLQSLIVLNDRLEAEQPAEDSETSFRGGEFLFCDDPLRRPSDQVVVPAGRSDLVLFCSSFRLVKVGDIYGQRSVQHGMAPVTWGTRRAIGIPFHEFE